MYEEAPGFHLGPVQVYSIKTPVKESAFNGFNTLETSDIISCL